MQKNIKEFDDAFEIKTKTVNLARVVVDCAIE